MFRNYFHPSSFTVLVDYYVLNSKLVRKQFIKDLDVYLDYKLNFNEQIDNMIKKKRIDHGEKLDAIPPIFLILMSEIFY